MTIWGPELTTLKKWKVGVSFSVVSESDFGIVVRGYAHILTQWGCNDTSNSVVFGTDWSYSGSPTIVAAYNVDTVFASQDIYFAKIYVYTQTVTMSLSVSGINVLGGTRTASGGFTIPARTQSIPNTPAAPSVSSIGQSSANINMSFPASNGSAISRTDFRVYAAASGGAALFSTFGSPAATSTSLAGFSPSTKYYAGVTATNGVGTSAESARTAFTTGVAVVPEPPSAPTISGISKTTATVTGGVSANLHGATILGHQIQIDDSPGFGSPAKNVLQASKDYAATGLVGATEYWARERINSTGGYSLWSAATPFTTSPAVPGAPLAPTFEHIQAARVTIRPGAANPNGAAITGHRLLVSSDPGAVGWYDVTNLDTAREISGLTEDETYYAKTAAINSVGQGLFSPVAQVTAFGGFRINEGGVWYDAELWEKFDSGWERVELWDHDGAWKRVTT